MYDCESMIMKLEISRISRNENNSQRKQKQRMLVTIWCSHLGLRLPIETGAWIPDAKQPVCTIPTKNKIQ